MGIGAVLIAVHDDILVNESDLFTYRTSTAIDSDAKNPVIMYLHDDEEMHINDFDGDTGSTSNKGPVSGFLSWMFGTCDGPTCTGTCYQSCDGTCFFYQGATCDHRPDASTCDGTCAIDTCDGYATCDLTCPGDGHTCWCGHETCDDQGYCTGT